MGKHIKKFDTLEDFHSFYAAAEAANTLDEIFPFVFYVDDDTFRPHDGSQMSVCYLKTEDSIDDINDPSVEIVA